MKRLITLMLLSVHLLNIGGQLAFHEYLVYKSDKFYNEQISKNLYNINDLTAIRIPAKMPGIIECSDYINLSGSVQFKNTSYNYVKIKITRNAIYLLCIPNYATTHLLEQNVIDARQIPDIPVPKKDHVPFGKINSAPYHYQTIFYKFSIPIMAVGKIICNNHFYISKSVITGPGQPPDRKCYLS